MQSHVLPRILEVSTGENYTEIAKRILLAQAVIRIIPENKIDKLYKKYKTVSPQPLNILQPHQIIVLLCEKKHYYSMLMKK